MRNLKFTILPLALLMTTNWCLAQTGTTPSVSAEFPKSQKGSSYVVYLGTYKDVQTFDQDEVPYELVDLIDEKGRHSYFFGKFRTKYDAEVAENLAYLAGYYNTKVRYLGDDDDDKKSRLYQRARK